jgi:hypothetical protein
LGGDYIGCFINVACANSDVLNAFAFVFFEIGDNLAFLIAIFVDRDTDAAAR